MTRPATPEIQPAQNPADRLRLAMRSACVAAPGAFNALAARAIARAGFRACYISGAATSVSAGVPDVGLLTLEHFARAIRECADASGLPVLADADTGFGEAEMVRRTVIEYDRAGAAGLHLEDQEFPKRCGHLDGKRLISTDHMVEKIRWAAKAASDLARKPLAQPSSPHSSVVAQASGLRESPADPAIIICARTDARGVEGFDSAVARSRAYAEAGAEMIFPEGLATEDEFARFAHAMRGAPSPAVGRSAGTSDSNRGPYLLANMTEFGKTPMIPLPRFAAMGYSVVIYPVTLLRVAMGAVTRALGVLAREGSAATLLDQMQTRQELYDLIGYTPGEPWEWPGAPR